MSTYNIKGIAGKDELVSCSSPVFMTVLSCKIIPQTPPLFSKQLIAFAITCSLWEALINGFHVGYGVI